MAKEKPTTKVCKHCKTEIPNGAKICPQCRKKQGPGGCLIAIIVVIALGLIGSLFGGKSSETTSTSSTSARETTAKATTAATTEVPIEYTAYSVDEMMADLKANALKAADKYDKQNVEITGRLGVIDSNSKYISLYSQSDAYAIIGIQCYIKDDEQKSKVMEMSKDDVVVLRGKIKSVGEVMGYSLDIDEIN